MTMFKQYSMHRLSQQIALLGLVLLSGCASLTPQQITERVDAMSDFSFAWERKQVWIAERLI